MWEAFGTGLGVHGACFEYGGAGTAFCGSGLAVLRVHCPAAALTQFGPKGQWDYRGTSPKETEAETKQRACRVADWLRDESLPKARGGAVILVAHATFLDLLMQRLLTGTDDNWQYGSALYRFSHAGAQSVTATDSVDGMQVELVG